MFGHACEVSHDRFCQIYVVWGTHPSDVYDLYGCYMNIVTLKIKVLCFRNVSPQDAQSLNIYQHCNINHNVLVCLVVTLSDVYVVCLLCMFI